MPDQMPTSVAWYERISYAAIALSVASFPLNWTMIEKYDRMYPVVYPVGMVLVIAIQILWVWFVARKRKNWARWLTVVWSGIAVVYPLFHFQNELRMGVVVAIAFYAINLIFFAAAGLLLLPEAAAWFRLPNATSTS